MTKELNVIEKGLTIAPGDCKLLDDCTCDRCQALAALVTVRENVAALTQERDEARKERDKAREESEYQYKFWTENIRVRTPGTLATVVIPITRYVAEYEAHAAQLKSEKDSVKARVTQLEGALRWITAVTTPDSELRDIAHAALSAPAEPPKESRAGVQYRCLWIEQIGGIPMPFSGKVSNQFSEAAVEAGMKAAAYNYHQTHIEARAESSFEWPRPWDTVPPAPQPEAPLSPGDTMRRVRDERIPQIRASLKGLQSAMDAEYGMAKESLFKTWSDWVATAICALAIPGNPDSQSSGPLSPGERAETLAVLEPFATQFAARWMEGNEIMVRTTLGDVRRASELYARLSASPEPK